MAAKGERREALSIPEARTLEQNTRCVAELAEGRDLAENGGADDAGCSKCLSEPGMIQCHEEIER